MTTRTTTRKTKRGFDGGKEDDGNNGNNAKKRTVAELKSELSKRELPTDGVKDVLLNRLEKALREEEVQEEEKRSGTTKSRKRPRKEDEDKEGGEDDDDDENVAAGATTTTTTTTTSRTCARNEIVIRQPEYSHKYERENVEMVGHRRENEGVTGRVRGEEDANNWCAPRGDYRQRYATNDGFLPRHIRISD